MADQPDTGSGSNFGFLTKKVGPLPVWMYGLIIVGAYYWYMHFGPGANKAAAPAATGGGDSGTPQVSGSIYKTNAEWEAAAINFLVGESVPPSQASTALYKYLHSQTPTAQEQKDIDLAIEGLGPPPNIPAPAPVATTPPAPDPKPVAKTTAKPVPPGPGRAPNAPVTPVAVPVTPAPVKAPVVPAPVKTPVTTPKSKPKPRPTPRGSNT